MREFFYRQESKGIIRRKQQRCLYSSYSYQFTMMHDIFYNSQILDKKNSKRYDFNTIRRIVT